MTRCRTDGTLWVAGDKAYGAFGDGTSSGTVAIPKRIGGVADRWEATSVAAVNGNQVCGIAINGSTYCWGYGG